MVKVCNLDCLPCVLYTTGHHYGADILGPADGYTMIEIASANCSGGWLGSRVVSVLDSGTEGPRFKSQSRSCRVAVLGKLFTPIVPLFAKQQNW